MKRFLIASVTVAAMSISGVSNAKPSGPEMRHQQPVKEIVKHLRGLSLSDAQLGEIRTFISAFKSANPSLASASREKPDFDFETASEDQITAFVQSQLEERESKQFALAELRHNIFNVLNAEQQATVLARESKREDKREMRRDKRRDALEKKSVRVANHGEAKGKRSRDHGVGDRLRHEHDGIPFRGIELTDAQKTSLAELRESFKEISKVNREVLHSFRDAQRELIRSASFSEETWSALVAQYKSDLVNAGVQKAMHRQAMFAVLTTEQQAKLSAQREERRKLRELFRS